MKNHKKLRLLQATAFILIFLFCGIGMAAAGQNIPSSQETIVAEDGSVWERVNLPGFGNDANRMVVGLCPFQGNLYAVTRNDVTGFEIWVTNSSGGWDQLSVPGLTDHNFYGYLKPGLAADQYDAKYNLNQNTWGDMIEYNGYLYLAVSSGYQGAQLYGSMGVEIWRFDGTSWEAVVSPAADADESGTISGISDCADGDAAFSAQMEDTGKSWTTDEFAGCVLHVEGTFDNGTGVTDPGTPGLRVFEIIGNSATQLEIQQNDLAGIDEYTLCAEQRLRLPGDFGRPDNVIPAIAAGDTYRILCGTDENGFGEMWNKSIVDFETLDGELYATVGLNYQDGTRIWKTADGMVWVPTSEYSFGLYHGYDPDGIPTGMCLVPGTESRNGNPISSSSTNFGKFNGTLFTGGTGTSGCNGRGARVVRLDGSDWTTIVDYFVDSNDNGTNENGFGVSGDFFTSNFQAWSWTNYDGRLFVSVIRLTEGSRIMYTDSGSEADGAWIYAVGGDSPSQADGWGDPTNMGSHIYNYDSTLFAGTIVNNSDLFYPVVNGADLWKAEGPANDLTWTRITGDAFGDPTALQFESFANYGGTLYVATSTYTASSFPGDEEAGSGGARIFRLASRPCVNVTADQSVASRFVRHTVTGITTPLPVAPDVPGFVGASYFSIADLDNDTIKDVVCTSGVGPDGDGLTPGDGSVAVFTWDGTNLDNWTQSVINDTFDFPNETQLHDMDGDDDLDILVMDNFIVSWFSCGEGGIYWLENLGGDITDPANWPKHSLYNEPDDGGGCPCSPSGSGTCSSALTSYHRARFIDLDGDGLEDFVTTKVHMWYWQWTSQQYEFMEWFRKETDPATYPSGFSGPYDIGDGGGFLFEMADIDGDGDEDILANQFFIFEAGFVRLPPGDPHGDSLIWFENPGQGALSANPALAWNRYTIDNEWTSPNTVGKAIESVFADIDNDGRDEIILSSHNHQQYSTYSGSPLRYWPSGIYYFEIPENPQSTSQWGPITIETGDPLLDPNDTAAVLADVFAVDRDLNDYNGQGSPGMVRAQDVTGDGFPELLVPGDGKGELYYYESQGKSGTCLNFKRSSLYSEVACVPAEAVFEDIDDDGDIDVIAGIFDTSYEKDVGVPIEASSVFVYENVGVPDDTTPPVFTSVRTNPAGDDNYVTLIPGTHISNPNQSVLWTAQDPGYADDGLGWGSPRGITRRTVSYREEGQTTWSTELEATSLFGHPGTYGMWTWLYPVQLVPADGSYEFRLAVEDAAGNRTEAVYLLHIDTTPPVFNSVTTNPAGDGNYVPLLPGTTVTNSNQSVLWTAQDPGYADDGLGWASPRGIARRTVSYRVAGQTEWAVELEASGFGNPGTFGMWTWFYPAQLAPADGSYDFRLAIEDAAGNRTEATYLIHIDAVP